MQVEEEDDNDDGDDDGDDEEEGDDPLDFEQREKALQRELAQSEDRRMQVEAQLQDAEYQIGNLHTRKEELELQLAENEEKCQKLQAENLQFIKAFDEHVDRAKAELAAALDEKYQVVIQEQGKVV